MNSKKLLFTTLSLLSIIGYGVFVFAAPPGTGGYNPGETLDPECTPGDLLPNPCIVKPSLTTADNGLTATGSNVQLGGVLLNDTTIATNGREFVVQGTNSKLVSGADPLGLFPLIGEAYPGVGISTDGILTGGVKSYIGALISPSNSKSLTVLGNFDIANGIQAAMVAEDNELNIYSSDGVSGSSNVSLRPGSLSLGSSDGIDIYANNYIRFNNFGSGRDDSGTNFPTNFLYTDGSGNLQSAPTSLLGGGGSSLSSQDEGTLLTSTTTGYNFIGAGVTATESGGLVTVNIPGGGGGADGSIYLNDGTLTGNRTLDANGNNLTFSNLDQMFLTTQSGNVGIIMSDKGSGYGTILSQGQELISGNNHRSQIATDIGDGNYDADFDDLHLGLADTAVSGINTGAAIEVSATTGIRFRFRNGGVMSNYFFPRVDGSANQVLTTDGAGQLSWQTTGSGPKWYAENATAPATAPIATGSGSIAFGSNARALASEMFVFGNNTGIGATNAVYSNFIGSASGFNATNASYTNALGFLAGRAAAQANDSQFIGAYSGQNATNASKAVFVGSSAGNGATNAAKSIFIGYEAGNNDSVNTTTSANDSAILIGMNTSTNGFKNSIALGAYATNTSSNQFMIGSTTRPIDETKIIGSLGTECTITTGTGMACTSDERLKTNITDLNSDTLSKLQNVRTVSYNWLQNPNSPLQIGFLAQNLEQYFPEMVMTDATGKKQVYYSQMTPILTKAIQEMNLNVTQLSDMTRTNTWRDAMIAWFESTTNGINNLFAKRVHVEQLCVGSVGNETCLTKDQVDNILNSTNTTLYVPPVIITPPTNDPGVNTETDDTSIDPGTDIESVPPTENTPPSDQPSTPPVDIPTE